MKKYILILSSIFSIPISAATQSELAEAERAKQVALDKKFLEAVRGNRATSKDIEALLEEGADPLFRTLSRNYENGSTALFWTLQHDSPDPNTVQSIIDKEPSIVNIPNTFYSEYPLDLVLTHTYKDTIRAYKPWIQRINSKSINEITRMQKLAILLLNSVDTERVRKNTSKRLPPVERPSIEEIKNNFFNSPEKPFLEKLGEFVNLKLSTLQDKNIAKAFKAIAAQNSYSIEPETFKRFAIQHAYEIYDQYLILTRPNNAV